MVTNISIINNIMNEYLLDYLQRGFKLNSQTMHGSQSDCPYKIDLSKGNEFIRILAKKERSYWLRDNEDIQNLKREYDYDNDVYIVSVARGVFKDKRLFTRKDSTVWMDRLEIIETRYVYAVGWYYNLGYTEDIEDVKRACIIQNSRIHHSDWDDIKDYTDIDRLRIGLKAVKKQPKTKSIHLENINSVRKYKDEGYYRVFYTTNSGKSTSVKIG